MQTKYILLESTRLFRDSNLPETEPYLPSGVYYLVFESGNERQTVRLVRI